MKRLIPYRDLNGYLFYDIEEPMLPKDMNMKAGNHLAEYQRRAMYIFCPNMNSLHYIGHCRECAFFERYDKRGVRCRTSEPYNPPKNYEVERPFTNKRLQNKKYYRKRKEKEK